MSILNDKVLISIKSDHTERRFFNRITQGFTARWNGASFYDTTGRSINVYFKSFKTHNQSESIWQAMSENDKTLVYSRVSNDKFTFSHLRDGKVSVDTGEIVSLFR